MTREDAIYILEEVKQLDDSIYQYNTKYLEALDMAIKALEQEPTTKNDLGVDCIVDVLGSYTDLDIPYKREIAENILAKLSSVAPQLSSELAKNSQKLEKNFGEMDCISRESIKQKLQEHHDFFVNAYGGFSNLPQNDKSRVDEIINCIAMVVNEPPVTPQEPVKKLEKQIKQLQNRCHALTHGLICAFCPYECEHKIEGEPQERSDT